MAESRVSASRANREAEAERSPAEIARNGYAAWNTGDLDAFLDTVHPEIVWTTARVFPGLRSQYSGHDGIREFWKVFMEPWETLRIEDERMLEIDPQSVLCLIRFHARGRDGIEADLRFTNHMVIREGKLFRFRSYPDWEQAVADLGIED
jgi:ketosteroid isomerase-like protein